MCSTANIAISQLSKIFSRSFTAKAFLFWGYFFNDLKSATKHPEISVLLNFLPTLFLAKHLFKLMVV